MMTDQADPQVRIGLAQVAFAGRSFVVDLAGDIFARAGMEEELLVVDIGRERVAEGRQKRPFLRDRRPELYGVLANR